MIEFAHIWVFVLAPLPLLLFWLLPPLKRRREALRYPIFKQAEDVSGEKAGTGAWISKRNALQWLLLLLAWGALLTALASPQIVGEPELKIKTARNFVIAADISFSMANRDWVVEGTNYTRWEGVKQLMREFIKKRAGDRIALVFFGTNAYLQAPLTTDHEVIDFLLDETDVGMAGQMTSIGKAIGYSIKIFETDTLDQKVMLLLTDGKDSGEGLLPTDAAKLAQKDSIVIYTMGIGDPQGSNAGLDEQTLKEISRITEGEYFLAKDNEQLQKAYQTLHQLEPMEYEEEEYTPVTLLYYYPLGVSVLLGLFLVVLRAVIKLIYG